MQTPQISRPIQPEAFRSEVAAWAARIKVKPYQIRLQRMTHKWASTSPRGLISFNTEVFTQPRYFREYVIVHELLHLKVPNHGKLFKSLLRAYLSRTIHVENEEFLFANHCTSTNNKVSSHR